MNDRTHSSSQSRRTDNHPMRMASRGSVNPRLRPSRSNPRYYGLVALRDAITAATDRHLRPRVTTCRSITAVDLGCGTLPYRPLFDEVVDRYIGADLAANPNADVHIDPQTGHVDLPGASCDLVISTQVLEHVESPVDYLREARRLVKPDGLLMLSTHGYWKYHPDPTDYWRWTGAGLCKLIESQGWSVIDRTGMLGFAAAAAGLMQDALVARMPRITRRPASIVLQQAVGLLDRMYTPQTRRENAALYLIVATPSVQQQREAA